MGLTFDITRWAAWAPGLSTPEAWEAWARSPSTPRGAEVPPLTEVPAMQRRRVEKLGRLAVQVTQWAQGERRGLPLVFASRHGDAPRSAELLSELAKGAPLSPASFALSVHNAVGGQYSIIRGETANVVAVANGLCTPEAGLLEALTLAEEAVLVVYDASPHPLHEADYPEAPADYAWAWQVKRGGPLSLTPGERDGTAAPGALPHALALLAFALSAQATYRVEDDATGYVWRRS